VFLVDVHPVQRIYVDPLQSNSKAFQAEKINNLFLLCCRFSRVLSTKFPLQKYDQIQLILSKKMSANSSVLIGSCS